MSFEDAGKEAEDLLKQLEGLDIGALEDDSSAKEPPKQKSEPSKRPVKEQTKDQAETKKRETAPRIPPEKISEIENRMKKFETTLKELDEKNKDIARNIEQEVEKRVQERLEEERKKGGVVSSSSLSEILKPSKELDKIAETLIEGGLKIDSTMDFSSYLEWCILNFDKLPDYQTDIKRMVTKKYLEAMKIDDALKKRVMGVAGEKEGSAETRRVSLHFSKILQYIREQTPGFYLIFAEFIKQYTAYLKSKIDGISK